MAVGFGINPNDYRFGMPGVSPSFGAGVFSSSNPTTVWNEQIPAPTGMGWPSGGSSTQVNVGDQGLATPLGLNVGTANLALGGLSAIGNIWASLKQLKLAKQQFHFQKDFANANFANQLKSYNTSIADRARSRGYTEGQSQGQIDSYVSQNSLVDTRTPEKKKKG